MLQNRNMYLKIMSHRFCYYNLHYLENMIFYWTIMVKISVQFFFLENCAKQFDVAERPSWKRWRQKEDCGSWRSWFGANGTKQAYGKKLLSNMCLMHPINWRAVCLSQKGGGQGGGGHVVVDLLIKPYYINWLITQAIERRSLAGSASFVKACLECLRALELSLWSYIIELFVFLT